MSPKRQLLIDVSELVNSDAGTGVQRVVKNYLKELLNNPPKDFVVRPVYAKVDTEYFYANQFVNNFLGINENKAKDKLIEFQRGDIFFALDMQHHVQLSKKDFYILLRRSGVNVQFLVYDLLPIQLPNYFHNNGHKELHEELLTLISSTDGAICISESVATDYRNWLEASNSKPKNEFQINWIHMGANLKASAPSKGLPDNYNVITNELKRRPTFLTVGTIEPRKAQKQIFDAVNMLWKEGFDINLVIVGREGWETHSFIKVLESHPENGKRLFWLNGISDEFLDIVYDLSTCLIAASINEGFGLPLIEAAHHNIPIIARDISVFREVAKEHAFYFSGETAKDLSDCIKKWLVLYKKNEHPKSDDMPYSTWEESAQKLKQILTVKNYRRRQLFVDISELVQRDAKTGIQRVVRNILNKLIKNPPNGYFIEPVYTTATEKGYRYARQFMAKFTNDQSSIMINDDPIDTAPGDIFLGLDMSPDIQIHSKEYYRYLMYRGVDVYFLIHDLLPLLHPEWWSKNTEEQKYIQNKFSLWLETISTGKGIISVSEETRCQMEIWLKEKNISDKQLTVSHNGVELYEKSLPNSLSERERKKISFFKEKITFLMVGTLEPRKGHKQTLEAFEKLWQNRTDINLVIVGKKGWLVEELVEKIKNHPELDKKLFWLEGISDEYLEQIYEASTCLIAASEGEGFGLPLIEAAQHKIPIIARDIPVFREVAGEYGYYFENNNDPDTLAKAIKEWLELYKLKKYPKSDNMPYLTWEESTHRLLSCLNIKY
jgi:glycosyltransferase involved in cell wall biosynthesis